LPDKDYSAYVYYFVTINTFESYPYFGDIINHKMYLNDLGEIGEEVYERVIRNAEELESSQTYIRDNTSKYRNTV
jgi:hypothetical protein